MLCAQALTNHIAMYSCCLSESSACAGAVRVGIFALTDIVDGEELTYDYGLVHSQLLHTLSLSEARLR